MRLSSFKWLAFWLVIYKCTRFCSYKSVLCEEVCVALGELVMPDCGCRGSPLPWSYGVIGSFDSLLRGNILELGHATSDGFEEFSLRGDDCCVEITEA